MPTLTGASYDAGAHTLTLTGTGLGVVAYDDTFHRWVVDAWDGTEAIPSGFYGANGGWTIDSGTAAILSQTSTTLVLHWDLASSASSGLMAISLVLATDPSTWTNEYGYVVVRFPGASATTNPWWHHYSDPITPTAGSLPEPPPVTAFASGIVRTIGTVQLNDGVNSRVDRYEFNGTAFVQAEPLWNQGGQVAVVKADKKGLVVAVFGVFQDGGGVLWEDWIQTLEAQQNVVFVLGDGFKLTNCWVTDIIGTHVATLDPGPPPVRVLRWSLKLTSRYPTRVAV